MMACGWKVPLPYRVMASVLPPVQGPLVGGGSGV